MSKAEDIINGRNSENHFDYGIVLNSHVTKEQSTLLLKIFQKQGFFGSIIDDPKLTSCPILFLGFDNTEQILKTANRFHFLKRRLPEYETIPSKAPSIFNLTRALRRKKVQLDKRIVELEKYSQFTFNNRHFFYNPHHVNGGLNDSNSGDISNDGYNLSSSTKFPRRNSSRRLLGYESSPIAILKQAAGFKDKDWEVVETVNTQNIDIYEGSPSTSTVMMNLHDSMKAKHENLEEYLSIFTPAELLMILDYRMNNIDINLADMQIKKVFKTEDLIGHKTNIKSDHKLIHLMEELKIIKFVTPLHTQDLNYVINDLSSILGYFGEKIAFYFEFMRYYRLWLLFPGIIGILITFGDQQSEYDTNQSPLETIYSIFILFWATLFMIFWERHTNKLRTLWGSYGTEFKKKDMIPEFKGEIRINYVTELPEFYYPTHKRLIRYGISLLMHLPILIISFLFMIFFLNIRDYIKPNQQFYIEYLSNMAKEGGIFDINTSWKMIATLLQVLVMLILSIINKNISIMTTEKENHMTYASFNNSLIIKRFAFEILNNFTHLAWIAFYRLEILELKKELMALYTIDELRRIITESIIPYTVRMLNQSKVKVNITYDEYIIEKIHEVNLPEYDSFDDYLEMIIQFGYVTLFAASFPLAGLWSLIFNSIELLSDFFKLKTGYRRPIPMTADGIGSWKYVMNAMSYLCVITNLIIIAFSSDQIVAFLPSLFTGAEITNKPGLLRAKAIKGKGKVAIGVLFLIEHVIVIVLFFLRSVIGTHQEWIKIYKLRKYRRSGHQSTISW